MSSEMRELIRKEVEQWVGITRNRDIERSARVWMEGYDAALTYCADRISALLARTEAGPSLLCQSDACAHKGTAHNFCTPRTEAGADLRGGNVRFDVRLKNVEAGADGPIGWVHQVVWEDGRNMTIYENEPKPLVNPLAGFVSQRIVPVYTRPQDASGDAEALQDLMTTVRAVAFSGDYGISDEAISALSDALDDAMQAKEAK